MSGRPQVGMGIFVWKDGKFLMGKRKGAHGADTWSLPGGHIEFGESWEDTAAREVMEETGLKINNVRFVAATNDIMPTDNKHYITIWMDADWASGEPINLEPDKCEALEWRTFESLPSPLFEPYWSNLRAVKPDLFE